MSKPLSFSKQQESDSTEFKAIFVKKDSTPLERVEIKKLLEDRDKKRQETKKMGRNENWIVRHVNPSL